MLRKANKTVEVYLDNPSERDYFIASVANKILMNKQATLSLRNFRTTLVYFAELLAKIGMKADAIVAGTYKTAPRIWTNTRPEKEEIEVTQNILNNFYDVLLADVAKSRNLESSKLESLFNRGEITAVMAKEAGLVDDIVDPKIGKNPGSKHGDKNIHFIPHYEDRTFKQEAWHTSKRIAVIPIVNTIVEGHIEPGFFPELFPSMGADDIIDEIELAKNTPIFWG